MTILVDSAIWRHADHDGVRFAHLISDESYDELHRFAARLGIPRHRFQDDHYDVPAPVRARAIEIGAHAVTSREVVRSLRASGLRRGRGTAQEQAPSASTV